MKLSFTVRGVAAPQGSMYARYSPRLQRAFVVPDNKKTGPWRQEVAGVAEAARAAAPGSWPTSEPVELRVRFALPRPTGHSGKRGLKASAPRYPAKKPDLSKLVRALEDALSGIVYDDDARIVRHRVEKVYAEAGQAPCAFVEVEVLAPSEVGAGTLPRLE